MALVVVKDVRKVYRRGTEEVTVLDGLSLDIAEGDFVALMGPSGSGKTTLLNLIGGVDQPTSGQVSVADTDIGRLKSRELARWRPSSLTGFASIRGVGQKKLEDLGPEFLARIRSYCEAHGVALDAR